MGFRFRKSVKLLPGIRLNFSTRGVSTSLGGRGATVNIGRKGARATSYSGSSNGRTTTHYRRESYFLCPPCHDARRRAQLILAAIAAVALAVVWLIGALQGPSTSGPPQAQTVAEPTNLLDGVDLQSVDTITPNPIETAVPETEAEAEVAVEPEQDFDISAAGQDAEQPRGASDAWETDIQLALSSGKARLWRRDGETGYVVPSELQAGVNAQCRGFVVTMIEGQAQPQIQSGERCLDEASGQWVIR